MHQMIAVTQGFAVDIKLGHGSLSSLMLAVAGKTLHRHLAADCRITEIAIFVPWRFCANGLNIALRFRRKLCRTIFDGSFRCGMRLIPPRRGQFRTWAMAS